ncbi:ATP-binding cassette sub-family g member 5 [Plakobranchus ocellatus]|uniref:ATP-binding cassette sub-family g member 5 n=1 Tax=Plakobranchus ocellatus TaxID=259542 RepID=A0AAV4BB02_9GAST|nr:ATP-binding cassette sub-family g member 5 [Plakobranchus ocellatus]
MERERLLKNGCPQNGEAISAVARGKYGAIRSTDSHENGCGREHYISANNNYLSVDQPNGVVKYSNLTSSPPPGVHCAPVPYEENRPHPPISLSIVGLTYTVKERSGHWWSGNFLRQTTQKKVLHNLCLTFKKGELTALVGSSGSGKTSLLDVISGRAEGQVEGVVSYKHEQCTRAMMRQKASYVIQADRLLPTLTVRETLTYMALMKLPRHLNKRKIDRKVQRVIDDMGLRPVAESRIGGAMIRGVSGGEKRRISIALQLLRDPEILLLDEPTSGLDSFTASHLVSTLATLAHRGDKLVLMTIHQPRSDIFNMVDRIGILTMGQLAYLGPPSHMVPYFTSIGYPCPKNENPCDVYIDITSVDRRNPQKEQATVRKAHHICNTFAKSELQESMIGNITSGLNYHYDEDTDLTSPYGNGAPSWFRIFHSLLVRMNIHLWRERSAVVGRLIELPLFVPFIVIFVGQVGYSLASIQDRLGILYQATQATPYMGLTNAVARFPSLRELYYRETQEGMYSAATFLSAYFVHILPFNIICSTIFASFLYWVAGLNEDLEAFGMFILVCVMLTQFGEMMAVAVLGVFRSFASMPKILKWLGYIAVHKYSTEIVVANEFHGLKFVCPEDHECSQTGDSYLRTYYPGAVDHRDRNFSLMGGYSLGILIFTVLMFKARGSPTLH